MTDEVASLKAQLVQAHSVLRMALAFAESELERRRESGVRHYIVEAAVVVQHVKDALGEGKAKSRRRG